MHVSERDHSAPIELLLGLQRGPEPLRLQLERQLREGIRAGRLRAGTRLPATRDLARSLAVSRGVVVSAYEQLAAEGYLVSRRRGGTFVASDPVDSPADVTETAVDEPPRFELRPGFPDLAAFPRREWLRAAREMMTELPDARLAKMDPRGAPELRDALASYLGRVRGVVASPGRLMVSAGYTQALYLLCRALRSRGLTELVFEDPCWTLLKLVAENAGLQTRSVPVDDRGLRVDELAQTPAQAVVVTPAHHFPTGVVMAPERRAQLLDWAELRDGLIIEDDYDGEFRFDRDPVGALHGRAPDRVIYGGSASKALAPALRIGWLVAPAEIYGAVIQVKALAGGASPVLTELTFARLLESGAYDRHLRRQRRAYARRRAAVVEVIEGKIDGARVRGVEAGLHAVIDLPEGLSADAAVEAAARRGVAIERLSTFASRPAAQPQALVLGYAGLPEPTLRVALKTLVETIQGLRPS